MMQSPVIVALNENHDASVAVWGPDVPLIALATERITRLKHDIHGIERTLTYILNCINVRHEDVSILVRCTDPVALPGPELKARTAALRLLLPNATFVTASNHHELHALAARQMAPHSEGAILVVDGMGSRLPDASDDALSLPRHECATIFATPDLRRLYSAGTTYRPYRWHEEQLGLGRFYSYVSKHIFGSRYDAGKTMALAAYGDATRLPSFLTYTGHPPAPHIDGLALSGLDAAPGPRDDYLQFADLAARAQTDVEDGMLALARMTRDIVGGDTLFISGGVALNCPSNIAIQQSQLFSRTLIHPAATDDGVSLGGLIFGAKHCGLAGAVPPFTARFLGPPIPAQRERLRDSAAALGYQVTSGEQSQLIEDVVEALASGKLVALYDAESEFGPRALGHRSLIADPSAVGTRDFINTRVKGRETFRPLAPVIIQDRVADFFEVDGNYQNPYMLLVARAKPATRQLCAAAVHVDGTARVQTVLRDQRPHLLAGILAALERSGRPPIVLNTSLNGPNEPIVETPENAMAFFHSFPVDILCSRGLLISKPGREEHLCHSGKFSTLR